jgi:hypothetical protein
MKSLELLHRIVYLDRDYIAGAYEALTGNSPTTQITKNEGKKAGAQIPFFAAEVSATETRSFGISSIGMLEKILPKLNDLPTLEASDLQLGNRSSIGWIAGEMSVFMVNLKRKEAFQSEDKIVASEKYFAIHCKNSIIAALITTNNYFSSGVDALLKLYETVLAQHGIQVTALVRVYPAKSDFGEWVAVPLVIVENEK